MPKLGRKSAPKTTLDVVDVVGVSRVKSAGGKVRKVSSLKQPLVSRTIGTRRNPVAPVANIQMGANLAGLSENPSVNDILPRLAEYPISDPMIRPLLSSSLLSQASLTMPRDELLPSGESDSSCLLYTSDAADE